jgi:hypothetical protein
MTVIKEGISIQLDVEVHNIETCCECSVSQAMDRVMVNLSNRTELPLRRPRIFLRKMVNGKWVIDVYFR